MISYPTSKINCTLRIFYTIHGAEDVYQHVFSFIIFFLCLIRLTNWNITNYPDTWSMNYSVGNYRPDQWHIDIVIPQWDSDTLTNWNISRTESPAWWKRHGSMIFAFPRSDRCPPETKFLSQWTERARWPNLTPRAGLGTPICICICICICTCICIYVYVCIYIYDICDTM